MAQSMCTDIDDVEMSYRGMQLLLNNDLDACQNLFNKYRLYSPLMNGGWSFVSFMVNRREIKVLFLMIFVVSSERLFRLMIND